MRSKGIIRNITKGLIFIEPLKSDPGDVTASCTSGSCESCGKGSKKKLIQVLNPEKLSLKPGNIVEFEISSSQVLKGALKVLILPFLVFAGLYFFTDYYLKAAEPAGILIGLIGFISAILLNFLFKRKSTDEEKPEVIRVL